MTDMVLLLYTCVDCVSLECQGLGNIRKVVEILFELYPIMWVELRFWGVDGIYKI
jgi:hypothetical protein